MVNHTRLRGAMAVPTQSLAPVVQHGSERRSAELSGGGQRSAVPTPCPQGETREAGADEEHPVTIQP